MVTGSGAEAVLDHVAHHPKAEQVLGQGPNKASILYGLERLQVDVRALPHESF
jgi:DNA polymerase/3'-5' exonuclease PolX